MPVVPGLPPAEGTPSFTSSDGKALDHEVKVHCETSDWPEPWTVASDAIRRQDNETSSALAPTDPISNAVFPLAPVQNTLGCSSLGPAFSHHQAVCSVAPPPLASEAGTSSAGPHQSAGSFSGVGLPAFDPTKPPPLFGEQNEKMQTSVAEGDVLGNWSKKLKQDQAKNENASKNADDLQRREETRNGEKWNQAGGTPTDVARRSDMRPFSPFSDRGNSFEVNPGLSSTPVIKQVAQSEVDQIFSPGNDLKPIPSSVTCHSFGNGGIPQDEMHWMSQNNPPIRNFPNSSSPSFAHIVTSSSAGSLNNAALQYSHQGICHLCLYFYV